MSVIAVLLFFAALAAVAAGFAPVVRRALAALAPALFAAVLFALPVDEARADGGHSRSLHSAIGVGDLAAVIHLLDVHRVDVDAWGGSDRTPLRLAIQYGRATIAAALIMAGARVTDKRDLHSAVSEGHASIVSALLAAGARVDARTNNQGTALHLGARNGDEDVVFVLLGAGANVDAKNLDNETPLHWGVRSGTVAVVSILLVAGADVEARTDRGNTPLHWGAGYGGYGHTAIVSLLLAAGANVNARTDRGNTPLHWGAGTGDVAVVSALLAAGANVNARSSSELSTPLHRSVIDGASRSGDVAVVSVLLAAGADVNAKNPRGETPLHFAISYNNYSVAVFVSVISVLLSAGVDANAKDNDGYTSLHEAVYRHINVTVVSALLLGEVDVDAKDNQGRTPLHLAVQRHNAAVVPTLLDAGANVNVKDNNGRTPLGTPLDFATSNSALVSLLISAGGHWGDACENASVVNPSGRPPCLCESPNVGTAEDCQPFSPDSCGELTPPKFYDAATSECVPLVKCHATALRKADNSGCECPPESYAHGDPASAICHPDHTPLAHDPDGWQEAIRANDPTLIAHFITDHKQDPDGNYELHTAAREGYHSAAKALIEGGANLGRKNDDGHAPLHLAVQDEQAALITLLLRRGANINATDRNGDAPLHLAARRDDSGENAALVGFLLARGANPNLENNDGWRALDLAFHGGEPQSRTWEPRREMMRALAGGGGSWADDCPHETMVPNWRYRGAEHAGFYPKCQCPARLSEWEQETGCHCPTGTHAEVNGKCLRDAAAIELEAARMRLDLARLQAELVSLNMRLSLLAEMPREMVEATAEQAAKTAREIEWRRDNFIALNRMADAGARAVVARTDTAAECRMLGGTVHIHSATGIAICRGVDRAGTFCLVDAAEVFPCRGLFRHVRRCNEEFHRPAVNPFLCGPRCGDDEVAAGGECE